jgi:hypothetical protein
MTGSHGWYLAAVRMGAGEYSVRCAKMDGLLRNGSAGPDLPTNHKRKVEIKHIYVCMGGAHH